MNAELILKVADAIEAAILPTADPLIGFNMGVWVEGGLPPDRDRTGHGCETCGCIAGWTALVGDALNEEELLELEWKARGADVYVYDRAKDLLGLTPAQAANLFAPNLEVIYDTVTAEDAVATLRDFARTGEIVWNPRLGYRPRPTVTAGRDA